MINLKFKKKPVVIEAFQMTERRRHDNADWPEWLNKAWNKEREEEGAVFVTNQGDPMDWSISIRTLEGNHLVTWNDFIIRGVKGELYPCKPDVFAATYEEVLQ